MPRRVIPFALTFGLVAAMAVAEPMATNFNDDAFDWYGFDEGLQKAKDEGRLVFVLVKTDWCPHCKAYQAAFEDPQVTKHAGRFVYVMLDRDTEESISRTIAPDGDYVPRTMILSAEGQVLEALAPNWFGSYDYLVSPPYDTELAAFLDWVVAQPSAGFDG